MDSTVFQQKLCEHHIKCASDRKHEAELKAFEKYKQYKDRQKSHSNRLILRLFHKLFYPGRNGRQGAGYSNFVGDLTVEAAFDDNELD